MFGPDCTTTEASWSAPDTTLISASSEDCTLCFITPKPEVFRAEVIGVVHI